MDTTNPFDKLIEDLLQANGGTEDEIIAAIRAKRDELGDDASEGDIAEAFMSCIMDHNGINSRPAVLSEESRNYMEKATAAVKEFLDSNNWHYGTTKLREDIVLFEFALGTNNVRLRMRIHIEENPNVCRIDAILPILADATYEYPLCKKLASENYMKRFGSFKYDEQDGEISYEYSFLAHPDNLKDDLDTYFHAVTGTASSCYDDIRKYCAGRFKSKEVSDIVKKANDLVREISE